MNGPHDRKRFCEALNNVNIMFRQADIEQKVLDVYYAYLERYEIHDVLQGLRDAIKLKPDFFPTAPCIESCILNAKSAAHNRSIEASTEILESIERRKILPGSGYFLRVDTRHLPADAIRDHVLKQCPPPNLEISTHRKEFDLWAHRYRGVYQREIDRRHAAIHLGIANRRADLKLVGHDEG